MLLRAEAIRLMMLHLRGRCAAALAAQSSGSARDELLGSVRRDAAIIRRTGASWARPWGELLLASVTKCRGDTIGAADMLRKAELGLRAASMDLYAAAAKWKRSRLLGSDSGEVSAREAAQWMANEGVSDVEAFVAMLVP